MTYPINLAEMTPALEFFTEVEKLAEKATDFLNSHKWCNEIYDGWLFTNIGYSLCIFLFEIENTQSKEDNLLWVVVGDLPSMYLDTGGVANTIEVIDNYIDLAEDWVNHVNSGEPTDDCYPFEAPEDPTHAALLRDSIVILETGILNNIDNINFKVAIGKN
jgi:hypothetical protein